MKTISPEYAKQNYQLHRENASYGVYGHRFASIVDYWCNIYGIHSVIDYGCGKGTLGNSLTIAKEVQQFDPAIPMFADDPEPADLVMCVDVLEHIEPEYLENVLKHLHELSNRMIFLLIAYMPSDKNLPDGRNAHLIVKPPEWWEDRLSPYFELNRLEPITSTDEKTTVSYLGYPKKS